MTETGRSPNASTTAGGSAARRASALARAESLPLLLKTAGAGALGAVLAFAFLGPWGALASGILVALVVAVVLRRFGTAARWRKGAAGERRTARILERGLKGSGAHIRHDLSIPGSKANIDHAVVTPAGVFIIDSKQRSGAVRTDSRSGWIRIGNTGGPLLVRSVRWEAGRVSEVLSAALGRRVDTVPVLAVHGVRLPHWRVTNVQGVPVLQGDRVPEWLRSQPRRFSESEAGVLAAVLAERFPVYSHG